MNPPAIHNAAFWGNVDNLRAELAEGVSPDLAYSDEHWSNFDDTGPPRAFLDTALASADEYMYEASVRAGGKGTTAFESGARNCHRVALVLLRADARTAVYPTADISDPYARRVLGAGGFKRYERAHLTALTATFAPKFPALPTDAVRVVVAFRFHVGYY